MGLVFRSEVIRRVTAVASVLSLGCGALGACGLSADGAEAPAGTFEGVDASGRFDALAIPDTTSAYDGSGPPETGVDGAVDASPDVGRDALADAPVDAPPDVGVDAPPDAGCVSIDAGISGALALSAFSTKGSATYNENGDGRITLTNSNNDEMGAAWYPEMLPIVRGYDLTWSLRVGPSNTAGDGITFAVLQAAAMPGVGASGDGVGLRNLAGVTGYAVDVDTFKNPGDPTDLGTTTLKLVTMPSFSVVAKIAVPSALDDGNVYAVDVSWRAPSSLTATLHGPGGTTFQVSSSDSGLATSGPAYLGFTGATGGESDSHNEVAGVTIASTCD